MICAECGKKFQPHRYNQKYCTAECREAYRTAEMKHRWQKAKEEKRKEPQLVEKEREARNLGISYGQLQARRYIQEHRLELI